MKKIELLQASLQFYCGRCGIIGMIKFGTGKTKLGEAWVLRRCIFGMIGLHYNIINQQFSSSSM
jgi:hypothetical protein